jgi:phage antirepressor YoqD-like protein
MRNDLVVKDVEFNGDSLKVAQEDNGKIYVGVSWVCNGIGLSEGQVKNERRKIQSDIVLKQGGRNLVLPTNGGGQDVLCIELDYLPLWLAKISITPKMQNENVELTRKLINYQLQAKDVLAKAFIHKEDRDIDNFHIPTTLSEALLLSATLAKENEEMKPKAEQFDFYISGDGTLSLNKSAKALKTGRNKLMMFLRHMGVFNQDNSPSNYYANKEYFEVKTYTVVTKENKKYQVATTRVTTTGQDFLFRFLKKNVEEYCIFDKKFKNKLLGGKKNA